MDNIKRTKEEWIRYAQQYAYTLDWEKDIPKEFIDEELVSKSVWAHCATIKRVPKKYITQKVWNAFARSNSYPSDILNYLDSSFNNDETWGNHLSEYPYNIFEIPEEFQKQEVWNIAVSCNSKIITKIPERFQTQEMWNLFARKCYREEIGYIPQKFCSNELFQIIAERGMIQFIPKKYQTQEMWNDFVNKNHGYIEQVPKNFQTQEMWNDFVSVNPRYINKVPKEYQTQEMWRRCFSSKYIQEIPMRYRNIADGDYVGLDEKVKTILKTEKEYFEQVKLDSNAIKEVPEIFQNFDMWQIYVKNNPDNVEVVPKNFQTQEMWVEFVKRNPSAAISIPNDFYNQEIFDIYISYDKEGVLRIPREFQTQEMWNDFVKTNPKKVYDVPEEFQTQEMWNNSEGDFDVPDRFKNELVWERIIKEYPREFIYMPPQFLNEEMIEFLVEKKSVEKLREIPKHFWTSKILELYFSYASRDDLNYYINESVIPEKLLTQSICERYIEENRYIYSYMRYIPKQFQTQEMWSNVILNDRYNAKMILLEQIMPIEFQTQEMWNNMAYDFILKENDLKFVPKQFIEGVKEIIKKQANSQSNINQSPVVEDHTKKVVIQPVVEKKSDSKVTTEYVEMPEEKHINKPIEMEYKMTTPISETETNQMQVKLNDSEENLKIEPKVKEQTLRQKFDINNEEDFNNLLVHYAHANKEYYSNGGKKHSEEEIKKRKNMNAQFKRILQNKAKQMPENENGEEFSTTIQSIEKGEVFSYPDLKKVAENKEATLRLFNIMTSGVYEKGEEKVRLTQKQRVALASTLEIISGMRLDMDKSKKQTKTAPEVQQQTQTKTDSGMGV